MKKLSPIATGFLTALILTSTATSGMANPAISTHPTGAFRCVENGHGFQDPSGYAPGPSCFNSYPIGGVENLPEPLAPVNPALTQQDLINTENTSVLSPGTQLGKDTYAYKPLTGKEPVSPISREMTADFQSSNYAFSFWSTGENVGQVGDKAYAAHENIPVYTVDSSNPHQNYIWVEATDRRATSVPGYDKIMAGKIPFPEWALKDRGVSGDKSVAIYDKATGIWRSMFFFGGIAEEDGSFVDTRTNPDKKLKTTEDGLPVYTYSSGGYIIGKPNFEGLGENNYWATLQGGTSSVAGMANELTQIGVDEIRAGEINHAISMTAADYYTHPSSFPAKQSDGRINMVVAEGDKRLDGSEVSKRFRVASFASGKIDPNTGNSYIAALQALQSQGVITLADDYTVLDSPITADTSDDEIHKLAAELGGHRGYYTQVRDYLKAGDKLTVTEPPLPYTPKTGQRFTIPADVDVEALADQHGLSEFDRMRLRAIQKYGGILTDRNAFIHAFNLEAPSSYAPYAREGKNVYLEDPEIVKKLEGSNPHKFPWQAVVWLDQNYIGDSTDTTVKSTSQHYSMVKPAGEEKETVYLPAGFHDQVYTNSEVYLDFNQQIITPRGYAFHAPAHQVEADRTKVSDHHDSSWHYKAGPTATSAPEAAVKPNVLSFLKLQENGTVGREFLHPDKVQFTTPTGTYTGRELINSAELSNSIKPTWNVQVVDAKDPIARTDLTRIVKGTTRVINPLANDEPYKGAKAHQRATEQENNNTWGTIHLLNEKGEPVKELESAGIKYTVTPDNKIIVDATGATEGIPQPVKYQVTRHQTGNTLAAAVGAGENLPEATSPAGTIQVQVFSQYGNETTPPVEPEQPTPEVPVPVEPAKPEPEAPAPLEPEQPTPVNPEQPTPEDPAPAEPEQPEPVKPENPTEETPTPTEPEKEPTEQPKPEEKPSVEPTGTPTPVEPKPEETKPSETPTEPDTPQEETTEPATPDTTDKETGSQEPTTTQPTTGVQETPPTQVNKNPTPLQINSGLSAVFNAKEQTPEQANTQSMLALFLLGAAASASTVALTLRSRKN